MNDIRIYEILKCVDLPFKYIVIQVASSGGWDYTLLDSFYQCYDGGVIDDHTIDYLDVAMLVCVEYPFASDGITLLPESLYQGILDAAL